MDQAWRRGPQWFAGRRSLVHLIGLRRRWCRLGRKTRDVV